MGHEDLQKSINCTLTEKKCLRFSATVNFSKPVYDDCQGGDTNCK